MTFLKSQLEYFCNQAELHATLPHCAAAEKLRSFLPSQSFFFFLPSVTLIVLHTTKKSCDEKDRLIISELIFSMF